MNLYSRRTFLSLASTVTAASALAPMTTCAAQPRRPRPLLPGNELCLIFAGSWLFVFEEGPKGKQIRAITPHFEPHAYHYGESSATTLGRATLRKGKTYTVAVANANSHAPTPSALIHPLVTAGDGFFYSRLVSLRQDLDSSQLRSVVIPMPDSIDAAGVVTTTKTTYDPSCVIKGTPKGPNGLNMPSGFVFRYASATGASVSGDSHTISIKAHKHLQFRTLLAKYDKTNLPCAPCDPNDQSEAMHEKMAFAGMMNLLAFPAGAAKPTIDLKRDCHSAAMPPVSGVDPTEYGYIPECPPPGSHGGPRPRGVGYGACGNIGGFLGGDTP